MSANAAVMRARILKCATYARVLRRVDSPRHAVDFAG